MKGTELNRSDISWLLLKVLGLFLLIYFIINVHTIFVLIDTHYAMKDLNSTMNTADQRDIDTMKQSMDKMFSASKIGIAPPVNTIYFYMCFYSIILLLGCYLFLDGRIVLRIMKHTLD